MGLQEVRVEFQTLVVVLRRLVKASHVLQAFPHVAQRAGLGSVHFKDSLHLQGVPVFLHGRERFRLFAVRRRKSPFNGDGKVVRVDSFSQLSKALVALPKLYQAAKLYGWRPVAAEVKVCRFDASFFVVAKGQLVQRSFVARVGVQGVVQDADGLFPLAKVLVLQRDIDVDITLEFSVCEGEHGVEMLERELVLVHLAVDVGEGEVDFLVVGFKRQQVLEPGDCLNVLASACQNLGFSNRRDASGYNPMAWWCTCWAFRTEPFSRKCSINHSNSSWSKNLDSPAFIMASKALTNA